MKKLEYSYVDENGKMQTVITNIFGDYEDFKSTHKFLHLLYNRAIHKFDYESLLRLERFYQYLILFCGYPHSVEYAMNELLEEEDALALIILDINSMMFVADQDGLCDFILS